MGNKAAVIIGPGAMYIAPTATLFPDVNVEVSTIPAWIALGYTEDGASLEIDPTFADVEVAEEVDPLFTLMTARKMQMVTTLAESTLVNLQFVFGGGTITPDVGPPEIDTYVPPDSTTFGTYALLYRTDFNDVGAALVRQYQIPEVNSVGAFTVPHRKSPEKTVTIATFKAIKPATGDILSIVNQTA